MEKMKISKIRRGHGTYIREEYNEDYIEQLRSFIRSGGELPPPKVTRDGRLLEGRHTVAAYEREGLAEIIVEIVPDPSDELDAAIISSKSHSKTKLPLLPQDYVHTFKELLIKGFTPKDISQRYTQEKLLRSGQMKNLLLTAMHRIWSQKVSPALAMLNKGKTIPQIAEELGIDITFLASRIKEYQRNEEKHIDNPRKTRLTVFKKRIRNHSDKFKVNVDYQVKALRNDKNGGNLTIEEYRAGLEYIRALVKNISDSLDAKLQRLEKESR